MLHFLRMLFQLTYLILNPITACQKMGDGLDSIRGKKPTLNLEPNLTPSSTPSPEVSPIIAQETIEKQSGVSSDEKSPPIANIDNTPIPLQRSIITAPDATDGSFTIGPLVRIFDSNFNETLNFTGYDKNYNGSVRVALGDTNGDSIAEILTTQGEGGSPKVTVRDGRDPKQILLEFFAFDATFRGGVFIAAGDIDKDGKADIITGAGVGGGPHVKVFSGANGQVMLEFFAFDSGFTGGVHNIRCQKDLPNIV